MDELLIFEKSIAGFHFLFFFLFNFSSFNFLIFGFFFFISLVSFHLLLNFGVVVGVCVGVGVNYSMN